MAISICDGIISASDGDTINGIVNARIRLLRGIDGIHLFPETQRDDGTDYFITGSWREYSAEYEQEVKALEDSIARRTELCRDNRVIKLGWFQRWLGS